MKTPHILYDRDSKKVLRRNPHGGIGLPATLYLEEGEPVPNPNPEAKRIPGGYAPRPVNLVYLKDLPRPTFDPSTHTIDGQTIDEQARTRSWVVRELTPEELDARRPSITQRVRALFTDLIPKNQRGQFGVAAGSILQLVSIGELEMARDSVSLIQVPPALAAAKQAIIDELNTEITKQTT